MSDTHIFARWIDATGTTYRHPYHQRWCTWICTNIVKRTTSFKLNGLSAVKEQRQTRCYYTETRRAYGTLGKAMDNDRVGWIWRPMTTVKYTPAKQSVGSTVSARQGTRRSGEWRVRLLVHSRCVVIKVQMRALRTADDIRAYVGQTSRRVRAYRRPETRPGPCTPWSLWLITDCCC